VDLFKSSETSFRAQGLKIILSVKNLIKEVGESDQETVSNKQE